MIELHCCTQSFVAAIIFLTLDSAFGVHSIADAFAVSSMSVLSGERSAMKRIRKTILESARLRYCRSVISVVVGTAVLVVVFAFFVLLLFSLSLS